MVAQPLAYVDQQAITVRDMPHLLAQVEAALTARETFTIFTLNLDHLVKRRRSTSFRDVYTRATFVTADGWPIVRLARGAAPGLVRTTGADCVIPLCRLAARLGVSVALYGSSTEVLARAADRLKETCPGLDISYVAAPPRGFDPDSADVPATVDQIAGSGARLCFVALGAPKQEIFADRAAALTNDVGYVCIGAALDFIAGAQVRAPALVQRAKLEWAWRLARQPRRLGSRYLQCAALFATLLASSGREIGSDL